MRPLHTSYSCIFTFSTSAHHSAHIQLFFLWLPALHCSFMLIDLDVIFLQTKINKCIRATEMYLSDRFIHDTYEYNCHGNITIFTNEILSIFKFFTKHFHCPWVNNLRSMEKLQKLNTDLRSVLEHYFKTNIWSDWKDISALHPQSSSSSSLFRMESYKCTLCNDHHAITKEEKHEYLVRAVSAVCILIRDISEYPCLNAASTADNYSTTCMQYNSIKILKKIYKITVHRLSVFDIYPAVKLNLLSGQVFFALCDQIYVNSQQLYSKILHLDINEMCMEKLDQTLQVYSRLSKCLQNFVAFVHPSKCVRCS